MVDWVWLIGIRLFGLSVGPEVPGLQLMKYSPISDCGRDWQNASLWKDPKPVSVILNVMSAWQSLVLPLMQRWGRSILVTFPAGTPATFICSPVVSPNELSSSSWYVGLPPELEPLEAPVANTTNPTTATARAADITIRLMGRSAPRWGYRDSHSLGTRRRRVPSILDTGRLDRSAGHRFGPGSGSSAGAG